MKRYIHNMIASLRITYTVYRLISKTGNFNELQALCGTDQNGAPSRMVLIGRGSAAAELHNYVIKLQQENTFHGPTTGSIN